MKIKKSDSVIVVAGKSKGKIGEVLEVFPKEKKLIVSGVHVAKKHQKPTANSAGGIIEKELKIDVSNVAILDPKENKATKVGYKIEDGKKVRFAKLSGSVIENK